MQKGLRLSKPSDFSQRMFKRGWLPCKAMPSPQRYATLDGNEAVARVAYALSETLAIYPITPSSPMGELADEWASQGRANLWGDVPTIVQMQSEAGAAGAIHGMLQAGTMATTFTASQGLLLMIPVMYKIAGELLPFCMHVSARTIATHSLSIFGDHSDVMGCRQTGFALLCSNSVQEAQDFAAVAHVATLMTRVPFLHFFDGFRTSHEVNKIALIELSELREMLDGADGAIREVRERGMSPDHPNVRGTASNPDTFFQGREATNAFHARVGAVVEELFARLYRLTGRKYSLCEYFGHPEPERLIVIMGSGAETVEEYTEWAAERGERVGVMKVRLYRPFPAKEFLEILPKSVRRIAVLDRTKEPGSVAEPLCTDVLAVIARSVMNGTRQADRVPLVVGGRYGLSSKEFTPAMVKAVFDNLALAQPRAEFTVGINDDVTRLSLPVDREFDIEPDTVSRAIFYGLGSDGTVGANKNSIKIIGEETPNYAQGYFVYDSKKSGSMTVSHLRFGPMPIRARYLIRKANFIACHHLGFLDRLNVLECAAPGATLLLNAPNAPDGVWDRLPAEVQEQIVTKKMRVYAIDASRVAAGTGLRGRINTIMQTCYFAISGVLPRDEAIGHIKRAIKKTYERKGEEILQRNYAAVDRALEALCEILVPDSATATHHLLPSVSAAAPDFVQRVTALMLANKGDDLPVSSFPVGGVWPSATSRWEKRAIAAEIPLWDENLCIQCNKCVLVCPHAAIRAKYYDADALASAPLSFKSAPFRSAHEVGARYTIQIAPEDCTGCSLCINVCPAKEKSNPRRKALNAVPLDAGLISVERENYEFFLALPNPDRAVAKPEVKSSQFLEPLFEYSGACAGCGETPYLKLLTQLFGDRLLIANATGCSSIYGGNLPTTPYTVNRDGHGPAWANSLFEDNAEFGLGIRLGVDFLSERARRLLRANAATIGNDLVTRILDAAQNTESDLQAQRGRVAELRRRLRGKTTSEIQELLFLSDYFVRKSVWIVGGDGWAYDIGFAGLDHIMASRKDINVLVLDTQVYSNTGGQCSKATPLGAVAKFAAEGKSVERKDLGRMLMTYGHVYVASVAMGAKDSQTVSAFYEAESYAGPSIIIAYSHCIAHGYNLSFGLEQQKLAVASGFWPLFRYDPRKTAAGERGFHLDSGVPKMGLSAFSENETRFRMLEKLNPLRAKQMAEAAAAGVANRFHAMRQLDGQECGPTRERGAQAG